MPRNRTHKRRSWLVAAILAVPLVAAIGFLQWRVIGGARIQPGFLTRPAELAYWPWPQAQQSTPHPGITHWMARQSDGTTVDLFRFDLDGHPNLRLELYDQDEDDAQPFDDVVNYWPRGIGHVVRDLNAKRQGKVLLAWNGLFFSYHDKTWFRRGTASHVAPVVIEGNAHPFERNNRWFFGWKLENERPRFEVLHLPTSAQLKGNFQYGAGGAQYLVRGGKPLKLQPFPQPGDPPLPQPVPSTPQEAGHIPIFDHMKTSRVAMAWSRDQKNFYLLFVKETDSETLSILGLKRRLDITGGWSTDDVQRFWMAMTEQGLIFDAINSDAGDVAQMVYRKPEGKYTMLPSRKVSPAMRVEYAADFAGAPAGGTLMYFYLRDSGG